MQYGDRECDHDGQYVSQETSRIVTSVARAEQPASWSSDAATAVGAGNT